MKIFTVFSVVLALALVLPKIRKAEDHIISQIVQSGSREMMSMVNLHNNEPRMSDSLGGSCLPPPIPTVSTTPSFTQVEIIVPSPKIGLIIGKGGETIRQLQEKSGAKMVLIQDGSSQEAFQSIRISGDPQKVEHAKDLVYEFMAEKEDQLQKTMTFLFFTNFMSSVITIWKFIAEFFD